MATAVAVDIIWMVVVVMMVLYTHCVLFGQLVLELDLGGRRSK